MPKGPNDAVKNSIEVLFLKRKERPKVKFDESFEEAEEIGSDLRKRVEVAGDEWQRGSKNHFYEFA